MFYLHSINKRVDRKKKVDWLADFCMRIWKCRLLVVPLQIESSPNLSANM